MNRIEICGGVASGKTTFAILMGSLTLQVILERFNENPFWEAFYTSPGKYIFETEITFTLLHYHQIKKQTEKGSEVSACDYSFFLDLAYARVGLNGSQLDVFERVYAEIYKELSLPSLLVHLKCDAQTELGRIRSRGRAEEKSIDLAFLDRLNQAVEKEVSLIQSKCPVITIDSAVKDFAHDESTKEEMRELMRGHVQQLTWFNPETVS